jgi:hypothetical protein
MKKYFIKTALLIAGTLAFVMGSQAEDAMDTLKVELLVFSGRPNPTFVISDQNDIREILGLAINLPRNENIKDGGSALPESKLGYQGFIVTNKTAISPEVRSFVVHGSAVQVALAPASSNAEAEQVARIDSSASLESKLLSHMKKQRIVDDKLLEFIDNSK